LFDCVGNLSQYITFQSIILDIHGKAHISEGLEDLLECGLRNRVLTHIKLVFESFDETEDWADWLIKSVNAHSHVITVVFEYFDIIESLSQLRESFEKINLWVTHSDAVLFLLGIFNRAMDHKVDLVIKRGKASTLIIRAV